MHATATFFYEGRIAETGEVFDDGRTEGITVAFGRAQVMPPVERALADMEVGEERLVEVPAEEGFGLHDPKAVLGVPLKDVPNGENLPVGDLIAWRSPRAEKPLPVRVVSAGDGVAVFDFNHPLAGKDLVYWVKLAARS